MQRLACRLVFLAALLLARPVLSCSVVGGPEGPASLVAHADVIAWVRAEGCFGKGEAPADSGTTTACQVRFHVLEVLKGDEPVTTLDVNGELTDADDPNDGPVPYAFVRPQGRQGNCFALQYREGAEYLLLLQRRDQKLTPYWSALAATNEQVYSAADPWLEWVRAEVRAPHAAPAHPQPPKTVPRIRIGG